MARPVWVLLADDDRDMRELLGQTLREAGYRVTEVARAEQVWDDSGDGALGPLAEVDLIVADVRLPGMSGLEFLRGLRRRDRSTPVVLISAFADQDVRDEARKWGVARVLAKPFGLAEFVEVVRGIVPAVPR